MDYQDHQLKNVMLSFNHFFELIKQPIAIMNTKGEYIYYNKERKFLNGQEKITQYQFSNKEKKNHSSYKIDYQINERKITYQYVNVKIHDKKNMPICVVEIGNKISKTMDLPEKINNYSYNHYKKLEQSAKSPQIIYCSNKMALVVEQAKKLARSHVPVMIVGETGTGKELFARLLHDSSPRANKPFIALNCSALPTTLIESTLFGTVKGAFTGAENNTGYLDLADGGTLFLDEVNTMPTEMQAKLLRFLQEKTYWRVGGSKEISADIRIITASNIPSVELLNSGKIRRDLFYRLNVGILKIPPLHERTEDIPILANFFIDKYRKVMPEYISGLSEYALMQLKNTNWPGNVRMLENVILRSMAMQAQSGVLQEVILDDKIPSIHIIEEEKIPDSFCLKAKNEEEVNGDLITQVEIYERDLIISALNHVGGQVSLAAELLKIPRTTLQYKIKKHNIQMGVIN